MIADDLVEISNYFEVNLLKTSRMKLHQSEFQVILISLLTLYNLFCNN